MVQTNDSRENSELIYYVRHKIRNIFGDDDLKGKKNTDKIKVSCQIPKFFRDGFNSLSMERGADLDKKTNDPKGFTITLRLEYLINAIDIQCKGSLETISQIWIDKTSDESMKQAISAVKLTTDRIFSSQEINVNKCRSIRILSITSEHIIVVRSVQSFFYKIDRRTRLQTNFIYPCQNAYEVLSCQKLMVKRKMAKLLTADVVVAGLYKFSHVNTDCLTTLAVGSLIHRSLYLVSGYEAEIVDEQVVNEISSKEVQDFCRPT